MRLISNLRPAVCLVGTVEKDTGIRALGGLHLTLKLKVLEFCFAVLTVENMAPWPKNLDRTTLDGKGLWILGIHLPAFQALAVKHINPFLSPG